MKRLLSKKSSVTMAIFVLLWLYVLVDAVASVNGTALKEPNIFISGGGSVELTWKSGKLQTYASDAHASLSGLYSVSFAPNNGWHIDAVLIDGEVQGIFDEDGYTLVGIRVRNTISVAFVENGGVDDVASGLNVEAYPDPLVGLIFDNVLTQGFVYAHTIIYAYAQPPNATTTSWDIQTDAAFDQNVTVVLVLSLVDLHGSDPALLRLLRTEQQLAQADVNSDGRVDGADVSIVAYANPSIVGDPRYDPRLDMNSDGAINDLDVNIVNNYIGESIWQDITLQIVVSNGFVYVYGVTNHFSIFGVS